LDGFDDALQSRRRPADRRAGGAIRRLRCRSQPPHRSGRAVFSRSAVALVGGAARGASEYSTTALQNRSPKNIKGRKQMTEANNRIAVVTGAGTGVGRAASLALMNAGFTVVLAGRRLEKLEETAKLGVAGKSLAVSADMTDAGAIAALFAKVMETYGRLDLL